MSLGDEKYPLVSPIDNYNKCLGHFGMTPHHAKHPRPDNLATVILASWWEVNPPQQPPLIVLSSSSKERELRSTFTPAQ